MKYYGDDLKQQGLKFPEVADPQPLFYKFNKTENEIFNETIRLLASRVQVRSLQTADLLRRQARGTRSAEPAQPGQVHEDPHGQASREQLPRVSSDARIASSSRTSGSSTEFRKGHVYISKKHINKIFDLLENDDQEAIERLLEADKAERLNAKDFIADFIRDLEERSGDSSQDSGTLEEDQSRSEMGSVSRSSARAAKT